MNNTIQSHNSPETNPNVSPEAEITMRRLREIYFAVKTVEHAIANTHPDFLKSDPEFQPQKTDSEYQTPYRQHDALVRELAQARDAAAQQPEQDFFAQEAREGVDDAFRYTNTYLDSIRTEGR